MDVVIEVEAATATVECSMSAPRIFTVSRYVGGFVNSFLVRPSASITRFLSMGSTSLSAVSPDNYFNEGGLAVA